MPCDPCHSNRSVWGCDRLPDRMEAPPLLLADKARQAAVSELLAGLVVGPDRLQRAQAAFRQEMERGLEQGLAGSSVQMENTHVTQLLSGRETGSFLALDLGSTNFR